MLCIPQFTKSKMESGSAIDSAPPTPSSSLPQTNGISESVDVSHNNNNDEAANCTSAECLSSDSTVIVSGDISSKTDCENASGKDSSFANDETVDNDEIFDFSSSDLSDNGASGDEKDDDSAVTHRPAPDDSSQSIDAGNCSDTIGPLPLESTPYKDRAPDAAAAAANGKHSTETDHSVEHYVDNTLKAIALTSDMSMMLSNSETMHTESSEPTAKSEDLDNVSDCAEAGEYYGEDEAIFHFLGKANEVVCFSYHRYIFPTFSNHRRRLAAIVYSTYLFDKIVGKKVSRSANTVERVVRVMFTLINA